MSKHWLITFAYPGGGGHHNPQQRIGLTIAESDDIALLATTWFMQLGIVVMHAMEASSQAVSLWRSRYKVQDGGVFNG